MSVNLENSAVATGLEKVSFLPIAKKGNAKERSNYHTIELMSHATKMMLKILQVRVQQYVNHELPDVQAGFRKGRGPREQIANIHLSFPGGSEVKASASNAEDSGLIPGLGRSPGEGNGNPLQYSCLENPMDREAW